MEYPRKIIEFYQDLGVDEVISETLINKSKVYQEKLSQKDTKSASKQDNISQNNTDTVSNQNVSDSLTNNFGNMTQSKAISRLAQKQVQNSNDAPLQSISDIIAKVEKTVSKIDNLEDLEKAVRDFDGCSLKKMATNTVFKDGDSKSDIMIIGEAPGNHEDLQGIPFCGDSGKLLNAMFEAIDYPREKLYITNTLFWRPPGNRRPTNDELAMCKPFVEKHIELMNPKLIILMGSTAMQGVLKIKDPISSVRGKILEYENKYLQKPIKTVTLFHPSYLMRQPNKKRVAWQDLNVIKDFLNN